MICLKILTGNEMREHGVENFDSAMTSTGTESETGLLIGYLAVTGTVTQSETDCFGVWKTTD